MNCPTQTCDGKLHCERKAIGQKGYKWRCNKCYGCFILAQGENSVKVINRDTKRLTWLQRQQGCALVSDDQGHWAVVSDGMQTLSASPPDDVRTTFFIEKHQWRKTIRRAIDAAMRESQNQIGTKPRSM